MRDFSIKEISSPDLSCKVIVREIGNRLLIDRKDLLRYFESQSTIDRLVHQRRLTPFYPNGQPKVPLNGRLPPGRTMYCLRQWQDIDYSKKSNR